MKKLSKGRLSELERKSEDSRKPFELFVIRRLVAEGEEAELPNSVWIIRTGQCIKIEDYPNREAFYLAVKVEMERVLGEPWNHDLEG